MIQAPIASNRPVVVWFTGLSGSGKTTTAKALKQKLTELGKESYLLDGDIVRKGLCKDLDFSCEGRQENLRRISEVAKILADTGLIVLVTTISPFERDRQLARSLLCNTEFIEVFLTTPFDVCAQRDTKGLYKMAQKGTLKNFTGLDSDYEIPVAPELCIDTENRTVEDNIKRLLAHLLPRFPQARPNRQAHS